MTEIETYKLALKTYGKDKQVVKMFEEMAELQKELCKNVWGADNIENIAEEIADVLILLAQMQIYFKCMDRVSAYKEYKLKRLRQRIERGNGLQGLDNTGTESV